jgi:hypothetical protein
MSYAARIPRKNGVRHSDVVWEAERILLLAVRRSLTPCSGSSQQVRKSAATIVVVGASDWEFVCLSRTFTVTCTRGPTVYPRPSFPSNHVRHVGDDWEGRFNTLHTVADPGARGAGEHAPQAVAGREFMTRLDWDISAGNWLTIGRCWGWIEENPMATVDITSNASKRFSRARVRGLARSQDMSAVVGAGYDHNCDTIDLQFRGGGSMSIPRRLIRGLNRASNSTLAAISVSPAGDALSWPSLNIDLYVPGLVERAFGSRLFAAVTGRRGGRTKSKAKTAAAKANGRKGGRQRKGLSS